MALKSIKGEVPPGAVVMTEEQALYYQWKQIITWPNRWDVWPILFGVPITSFLGGLAGLKINQHYRYRLKLRKFGLFSSRLAIGLTPSLLITIPHFLFVTEPLFLDYSQCIICLQSRAIAIQLAASIIWPAFMSPIANFMLATRHGTYPLPYWADYKGTFKLWMTMNKSLRRKVAFIVPIQILTASYITYLEAKTLKNLRSKIDNFEVENVPVIQLPD